jgi:hypothetical protein
VIQGFPTGLAHRARRTREVPCCQAPRQAKGLVRHT